MIYSYQSEGKIHYLKTIRGKRKFYN
uniref:Uncharacterized protein n=1 Tax=Arundo donax TaxID=35708 RepID=A0A0A8YV88_ARUDO